MKEIIDKLINSKIAWISLFSILGILLLLLVIFTNIPSSPVVENPPTNTPGNSYEEENKYTFLLKGALEITLYVNEDYIEPGFKALSKEGKDVSDQVVLVGSVDTSKVGEYELFYTLKTATSGEITLSRKVKVIEKEYQDISLRLNGRETVYLPKNYPYKEQGAVAYLETLDLSNSIEITNNIDTSKVGIYEVTYQITKENTTKSIVRRVVVFDLETLFKVNSLEKTKETVTIQVNTNGYFKYVLLPNKIVKQEKEFSYTVSENGTYVFTLYDEVGTAYEKEISITNIDRVAPTGSCKAVLFDGKTTFTVTSSDRDIKKYLYNKEYTSTINTYVVDRFLRESSVTLEDEVGNQRTITCQTELKTLPIIKPKSGETVKYKAESNTLAIYITKNNGYYLTRIWAKDPVYQMKKELVTGNSFKRPKVILETAISKYNLKSKIVFGGNASAPIQVGSYYGGVASANSLYNLKEPSALLIYNGKVIINDYEKYLANNTVIYYIDGSNQLKYIPVLKSKSASERKTIFENVVKSGVYNTFAFNLILVDNYKEQSVGSDYNAYRQGFCQIDSNNFVLVTSDTKRWQRQAFAKFMQSIGCKTAVNFDGGGSVALFYKPKGTNTVTTLAGNQRSLSSVMYFTELD